MTLIAVFSVITITYKDVKGLQRTCESLRALNDAPHIQKVSDTFCKWEHVVVDSSPEESGSVLQNLPAGWPLRHITVPARGIYNAMNEGVRHANGTYLWFLNGGDCLHSAEALNNVLKWMSARPATDIVAASVNRVRNGQYQFHWDPGPSFFKATLGACHVCHQGMIYRKESFMRVGFYDERHPMSADYEHHLRCLIKGLKIETSRECLADFDVLGGGATGYYKEFKELRQIHAALAPYWSARVRLLHDTFRKVHIARVFTLKKLQATPVSEQLRSVWLGWKRRHDQTEPHT